MGAIAITLFLGVSWLAVQMHARPSETTSVLSQIAHGVVPDRRRSTTSCRGSRWPSSILAANSSYQGFPRLAALLARDRFFPRQFVNLGDRLVYSNGIVLVAGLASALIVIFAANVDSLLHLYVLGVFTAFTLSQYGMVRYWRRTRDRGWQWRAAVNGVGAATTLVVTLVVIETKFTEGAWAVMVAIPLMVAAFYGDAKRHYLRVGRRLRAGVGAVAAAPPATNEVVLFAESYDAALLEAVWYARAISGDRFRAVSAPGRRSDPGLRARFRQLTDIRPDLELLPTQRRTGRSCDRVPLGAAARRVAVRDRDRPRALPAALARLGARASPTGVLAQAAAADGARRRRHGRPRARRTAQTRPLPQRAVCRILVSGAHAATMRAVHYASTLGFEDTKAIFFAFDAEEAARMRSDWRDAEDPCRAGDRRGAVPRHRRSSPALPRGRSPPTPTLSPSWSCPS